MADSIVDISSIRLPATVQADNRLVDDLSDMPPLEDASPRPHSNTNTNIATETSIVLRAISALEKEAIVLGTQTTVGRAFTEAVKEFKGKVTLAVASQSPFLLIYPWFAINQLEEEDLERRAITMGTRPAPPAQLEIENNVMDTVDE
jgi:hypothetical protein